MRVDRTATRRLAAVAGFMVPFAFVAYLGFRGGGYDTVVRAEAGVVAWGLVLVGALSGRFTLGELRGARLALVALLFAFALWTGLALIWTESAEKTFEELARVATYLGVLCVALALGRRGDPRPVLDAVAAAIAVIGALALLSHLHSDWFPTDELAEAQLGGKARLNYPLNYWNGLASLLAMGVPLLLCITAQHRRPQVQALAAAAVPVLALAGYFTFSRTGLIAGVAAVITLLALAPDRVTLLLRLAPAAVGTAVLVVIASTKDALTLSTTTDAAKDEGTAMLVIVVVVCLAVAGLRLALARAERRGIVPPITISRRTRRRTLVAAAVLAVIVALAAGAPDRVVDQWQEFKQPSSPVLTGGSARFASTSGSGRYQYWGSSLDAFASAPATGIGPGTFEYWWSREGTISAGFVKQAHSLYFETVAELGVVGLLIVAALIAVVAGAGIRSARRSSGQTRTTLAGLLAAAAAFIVVAGSDWVWEMPVIPITFLLIAAAIVSARDQSGGAGSDEPTRSPSPRARLATAAIALLALAVIVTSLTGAELIRQSQEAGTRDDYDLAAEKARDAGSLQPFAATPKLQEALALQAQGNLDPAALRAQEATEREPTNWKIWYALSTIDRTRGATEAADLAYERARSLNPRSSLFPQEAPPAG